MEHAPQLRELYHRYLNNECSADEIGRLLQLFGVAGNEEVLRRLIRQELESDSAVPKEKQEEWKDKLASTYQKVLSRIHAEKRVAETPVISLLKRPSFRIAAAAVLVLLASAAVFFYAPRKQEAALAGTELSIPAQAHDVPPGGDRAVLVLADGRRVVLDSAGNGALAQQGGTKVVKQSDGQLAYETGTSESAIPMYNTIATPRGGQYSIVLPDGSQVWLNAASSLRFPTVFTGDERLVEARGEVYFKVRKDPSRPFKVLVNGGTTVEVLGTEFNVMAYEEEDQQQTTLVEGAVKVYNRSGAGILKPGQQVRVARGGGISVVPDVDVAHATAWKNGLFVFEDEKIPAIMRQLSRWYDVEVAYEGPVPQGHYVGAVWRQSNISDVLRMLSFAGGVEFTVQGKRVIVKAR